MGLISKPTIDILMEIDGSSNTKKLIEDLNKIGYGDEIFTKNYDPIKYLLGKGYSINGYAEKVFHLHIRHFGDWDELYFRDYLATHSEIMIEYGKLKMNILSDIKKGIIERLPNGKPNGYSKAKLAFVEKYTKIAREVYKEKYKPKY
jgi:GrpB-like predicted nucleotidyltransferase (UPF0157 family)